MPTEKNRGCGGCNGTRSDSSEDIFINPEDGLNLNAMDEERRSHREERLEEQRRRMRLLIEEAGGGDGMVQDLDDYLMDEEFPTIIIAAGLTPEFFDDECSKRRFEALFLLFGEDAQFHYFRSFKRVRITYESCASAIQARVKLHLTWLDEENQLKCYFGQPALIGKSSKMVKDGLLHPPTPDKQFLISPPASPPVDWEPRPEYAPTINFDLISALAKLSPGEAHELYKPESESHPSIVVHIADEDEPEIETKTTPESQLQFKPKIIQTKRPD